MPYYPQSPGFTPPMNSVSDAQLFDMPDGTVKGRALGAGLGDPTNLTGAQLAAIIGLLNGLLPIGAVLEYPGVVLPQYYIWPAGQNVSRTTYALLYAKYGTTYGAGDGSTTFGIPDLRGRFTAARDDMNGGAAGRITAGGSGIPGTTLGGAGGAELVALTVAMLAAHTHALAWSTGGIPITNAVAQLNIVGGASCALDSSGYATSSGSGSSHQNMPPTIILNKIIFAGV